MGGVVGCIGAPGQRLLWSEEGVGWGWWESSGKTGV